jgi:hypothetical protein
MQQKKKNRVLDNAKDSNKDNGNHNKKKNNNNNKRKRNEEDNVNDLENAEMNTVVTGKIQEAAVTRQRSRNTFTWEPLFSLALFLFGSKSLRGPTVTESCPHELLQAQALSHN